MDTDRIVLHAQVFIKADKIDEAIPCFQILVQETRQEKGCIKYDLYQHEKNVGEFGFFEQWYNREALESHFKTTHFTEQLGKLGPLTEKPSVLNTYKKTAF